MPDCDRREFLAAGLLSILGRAHAADPVRSRSTIGLGFGTYGLQKLSTRDALNLCAEVGYDGIELSLMSGWATEPKRMTERDRRELRQWLSEFGLHVPSLLESLPCLRTVASHRENVEKLKRATQLAHDLGQTDPPIVQSIAGGKTASWEQDRNRLVDEIADWARIGEESGTTVCFKPHASHLVHTPSRALWIMKQIDSPNLRTVYDYSHFFLEGLTLEDSLRQLLPVTSYIQVKDSRGTPARHEYLLPGDGQTDYTELLSILRKAGYSGFVGVEVSSMIHRLAEYRPEQTARVCYQRLAPLFELAGIERP